MMRDVLLLVSTSMATATAPATRHTQLQDRPWGYTLYKNKSIAGSETNTSQRRSPRSPCFGTGCRESQDEARGMQREGRGEEASRACAIVENGRAGVQQQLTRIYTDVPRGSKDVESVTALETAGSATEYKLSPSLSSSASSIGVFHGRIPA